MIYIVRHGKTDWNKEGRYQGRIDVVLNSEGISQAIKRRCKIADIKFDKVFSSPSKRAYKTAQIICDNDIITDYRLIKRCNGKLEVKLKNEIKLKIDFNDPFNIVMGIDSIIDFRNRIKLFLDDLDDIVKKYKCYKLKNCEVLKYENN